MFLSATILWILVAKLCGGSFRKLAAAEIRGVWIIFAALLVRFLLYSGRLKPDAVTAGVLHTSAFVLLLFAFAANWDIHGMPIAASGSLLNATAVAANGGRMPVGRMALEVVGLWETTGKALAAGQSMTHVLAENSGNLAFLGDCLWLKLPWGMPSIYSIGDVLLMIGMFFAIMELMGVSLRLRPVERRRAG
ncbi:MAG: DUF5317 domain-containing protein [Bacillota bacterium]|nr:DUF5317 domain-containing protein [Bacillota bacterium]